MHYYKFNIGDYRRDASHLTLLEHGAYRQLLDTYYLTEKPIPIDDAIVMRTHCARSAEEKEAVQNVLNEFFIQTENGWIHRGCDKIIGEFTEKSIKAKASAKARWDADAMRTHSERNANHKPITNNQEPRIKPFVGFDEFWTAYPKKTGKGAAQASWNKKKPDLQIVLDALAWQTKTDQWTKDKGQYIPNPATWLNQERWLDENPAAKPFDLHRWNLEVQGLI